ncbi:hypothetical protein LZD49_15525 [Dyadobacter sp. CY261]|uniref:hypothetical protein n=1 Tax=Dyadobacter sp. CY261 TaxID=2907203 RepID=UPI001F35D32D|nr:hypothetical protein [Dyadobacter sp. CY261]MCF0071887.1 hypothetical protein [Dyadobacter sp. CY261]
MKLHKTTSIALQGMLLLGMLGACQNEDAITPSETANISADHDNSKIAAGEIKLVDDGDNKLLYKKTGRYVGKLSKVSEPNYYTEYSYADGPVEGDYWITSKRYSKSSNALVKEIQYHVVNKKCIKKIDVTDNQNFNFNYDEAGRLKKISREGTNTKIELSYIFNAGAGDERLYKTTFSNNNGAYKEITYQYSIWAANYSVDPKADKYPLNPVHLGLDRYLPIFSKFSDALVQQITISPLPASGQSEPYYKYTYAFDGSGYVTYRTEEYFPLGLGYQAGKQSNFSPLKYTSWVPGL